MTPSMYPPAAVICGHPFNPATSLAGLAFLADDQSGRWQDTGGTTAATSAGQAVQRWDDRSGNARHLTASSANPTLAADSGDPSLAFSRGSGHRLQAAWSPGTLGDFSIHALIQATGANFGTLMTTNTSGTNGLFTYPWTQGSVSAYGAAENATSPLVGQNSGFHLMTWTRSGSSLRAYFDGVLQDTFADSSTRTPDQISLGYSAFSALDARVLAFAVATAAHPASQISKLAAYWRRRFPGAWARTSSSVVWVGNSLGTGVYSGGPGTDIAAKTHASYTPGVTSWVNQSVGGKTTPLMLADHATRTDPFGAIPSSKCCFVIWEGTNDILLNSASGATAAANLFALSDAIKVGVGAGARVVIGTVIDRVATGFATAKAACNSALLSGASAHGVTIADFTGISLVSADGAASNSTYFADSTTHLNAAGNDLIKSTFGAAIVSALAS